MYLGNEKRRNAKPAQPTGNGPQGSDSGKFRGHNVAGANGVRVTMKLFTIALEPLIDMPTPR